jgi:hypothetical protein
MMKPLGDFMVGAELHQKVGPGDYGSRQSPGHGGLTTPACAR